MITKETKKVENKYEALKVLQKENIKLASDNLNYFRENYLKEAPLNQDFYKVSEENNSNLSLSEKYELASNLSKKNLELAKSNYDLFNSKIKKETGTKKDLESEVETRYSPKQEDLESEDKSNLENDLESEVKDKKNKKGFFRNIGNAVNDVFEAYINSFGPLGTDMLDREYPGIRKVETRYSPKQEDLESEDKLNLENDLESEVQLSPEETFEGLNKLKLKIDSNIIPNYNFLENKPVSKGEELVLYKLTDKSDLEFEVQVNSSYFSEEVSTGESSPETEVDYSPKEENLKSEVKETQKKKTEFFRNIGNAVNDVFEAYTNYFFNREKFLKFIQGQKGIYESTMGIESPVFLFKPTEKIFLPASSVDKTRKPFTKSKFNRKY